MKDINYKDMLDKLSDIAEKGNIDVNEVSAAVSDAKVSFVDAGKSIKRSKLAMAIVGLFLFFFLFGCGSTRPNAEVCQEIFSYQDDASFEAELLENNCY